MSKNPQTRLQVSMLQEIESNFDHPHAVDTFVATIDRIGIEVVRDLEINVVDAPYVKDVLPLIQTRAELEDIEERYRKYYKPHEDGTYWIHTNTRTEKKCELLEEIARQAGIEIWVKIVPK